MEPEKNPIENDPVKDMMHWRRTIGIMENKSQSKYKEHPHFVDDESS